MAAPPLADPPDPSPGGNVAATPAAALLPGAGPAQGEAARAAGPDGSANGPVETMVKPAARAEADEALEHGWTGLGLPAYDEGKPAGPAAPAGASPIRAESKAAAASPVAPPPVAPTAPGSTPALPGGNPPMPAESPPQRPAAPAPLAAPRPTGKSGAFPAVAPPRPTGKSGAFPAVLPPRPTGKSGQFAAVAPPDAVSRPSSTGPAPVPAPAPQATRPSYTGPGPAARPSYSGPAPAAAPPPELTARPSYSGPAPAAAPPPDLTARPSYTGAAIAPPRVDLGHDEPPEADVTFEDEPDFGQTIPDHGPRFDELVGDLGGDLTATVPMLPSPAAAPSFGLPPEPATGPSRPSRSLSASGASPAAPAAPAEDPNESPYGPGAIIGDKYRLSRVIGRGGMGAVWIAQNTALEVDVAIKLMRRDRATPEAAARFSTEARAAAKLGHPSIVRVFDFGETARGDPFIVMELLRGESFGALLGRKKKLATTVAVQTLLPVAHALAAAHAKGIVHRDLKPDNILLAKDESNNVVTPKVVDFGIAKLMSADVDRHFTIAGEILGSPDYMSPEQARGEDDIDHRTDIWTFSVLLYEAVCGKRPFDGSNYNALLAAIIASRPAPITELGVPDPGLWTILEKGLAKERDARWQSVREMGMELARWALEHGVEHDIAGASLSAQWLEPTRRRLFTVGGSGPPPPPAATDTAASLPEPTIPKPPPLGNLAAELPKAAAPAISNTLPPFVPRRRPWVVMAAILILGGILVAVLVWGGLFEPPAPPPAAAPEVSATALPSATAAEPPPATTAAPNGTASAKPTSSAKARPTATVKPRAPQVKGDIKF